MLTRIRRLLRSGPGADEGFTIVEVLVAMTIFAMIAMGVAAGIVSSMYLVQDNRSRETALNLATQEIDAARSAKDVFGVTNTTKIQDVADRRYSITRTTNWITSNGTDAACGAGNGQLAYKRVNVQVAWRNGASTRPRSVVMDTMIAPPSSVSSATSSTIVVSVANGTGGPNSGVTVTVTPVTGGATLPSQPAATDANGCTYALNVTPGTYKVTVMKSGNADTSLTTAPSAEVGATAGSVASKSFMLDQPATVNVQYAANAGVGKSVKLPSGITTSFVHGDTVTPASSTTTTRVFPYGDGWTVVAGKYDAARCTNVNPLKWTTPTSSGLVVDGDSVPTGAGSVAGGTSTVKVPTGLVDVTLKNADTVLVATAAPGPKGTNDPGCTTTPGTTYTFTGLNATTPTTIALPFGTFSFREGTSSTSLGNETPVFAATPGATNVNVAVSGSTVVFDPRTRAVR